MTTEWTMLRTINPPCKRCPAQVRRLVSSTCQRVVPYCILRYFAGGGGISLVVLHGWKACGSSPKGVATRVCMNGTHSGAKIIATPHLTTVFVVHVPNSQRFQGIYRPRDTVSRRLTAKSTPSPQFRGVDHCDAPLWTHSARLTPHFSSAQR